MALRAWYPLNGNVNNYGCGNFPLVQVTAPTWADGKLCSQALNSGAYNWAASDTAQILNNTAFSYACWIYVGDSDTRSRIFGNDSSSTRRYFALFQYPTKNDLHYSWTYNDSNDVWAGKVSGALPTGQWTHVCEVYWAGHARIYVNGVLKVSNDSITYSVSNFNLDYNVILNNANRRLQDVRIYDHALSAKEVRELSKGLMLHIPFSGDGYPGIGTNIANGTTASNSAWLAPKTINVGTYYSAIGINSNTYFGLQSGDTYTYRVKLTAPSTKGIKARIQYYTDSNTRTGPSGNTVAAGTTGYSSVTATLTDATRGYNQMQLLITNANTSVTSSDPVIVEEVKLERGSAPTAWSPALNSSNYSPDYTISDCSGYGRELTLSATRPIIGNAGPRYGLSATFPSGSYISLDDPISPAAQEFTISVWVNPSTVSGNQAIWNGRTSSSTAFSIFLINSSIRVQDSGSKDVAVGLAANTWYHIAVTWKSGGNKVLYVNGVQKYSATAGTLNKSNTIATIGISSSGSTISSNNAFNGMMSDYRIYATALSADDVKRLYEAPISIDNSGKLHSCSLLEGESKVSFRKTGTVTAANFSELYSKFDSAVRFEPDGSTWVRVVHHNNPAGSRFSSSDTFATQVYRDADRYCIGKMFDYTDRWELMVEQQTASGAAVTKYRWIQTANPNVAVFGDVDSADVTKISTTGYTVSSYGGIYKKNSSTYWCANNANSSNWMGALGSWTAWNGGIPGWGSAVTTGYLDLYLRVDGGATWTWPENTKAQVSKSDSSVICGGLVEY